MKYKGKEVEVVKAENNRDCKDCIFDIPNKNQCKYNEAQTFEFKYDTDCSDAKDHIKYIYKK